LGYSLLLIYLAHDCSIRGHSVQNLVEAIRSSRHTSKTSRLKFSVVPWMDSTQSAHVRNSVLNAVQTAQQLAHTQAKLCESLEKQLRKRPAAASAKHFRSSRARSLSGKVSAWRICARPHSRRFPRVFYCSRSALAHTKKEYRGKCHCCAEREKKVWGRTLLWLSVCSSVRSTICAACVLFYCLQQ
jgi:hypothetical protein